MCFSCRLVSVIKKTCQCMKEVLESSDKVLENALANGGESHTNTHAESVNYLIGKLDTGHIHTAIKTNSY